MPDNNRPDNKFFEWRDKQNITPDSDPRLLHTNESKYDTGFIIPETTKDSDPYTQLADFKGTHQPTIDKIGNAVPRLLSKVGTEVFKTPGYLYALGESMGDKTLAESLDNAWLKAGDDFDTATKEQFAIHKPKAVREGNLWDNLTSASFWTDEGTDGVGYLLSMLAPGYALKATGIAGKMAKLPVLSKVGASNIELGQATLLNTALESAAETKGIVDNLKTEFKERKIGKEINPMTGDLWTEEDAAKAIGDAAVNTFGMNMGLLLVPNTIMNKNLLGRFNSSKRVIDEFVDPNTGKLLVNNPTAKKSVLKEYLTGIGEATASEGLIEEAGQTTIENYNSKTALSETNKGFLEGLASEYINTLTTTEGQKAILLGGVLGSLGGIIGKKRELKQEAKDRASLSGLMKDNFEGFSVDMDNIFEKDEKGSLIIDPETKSPKINYEEATKVVTNLVREQQSSNLQDLAAFKNDKDIYDYIFNQQLTRQGLNYFKQENGIDILLGKIDESSKILTEGRKGLSSQENFDENTYKTETKETVKQLQKVYNSVYSTIPDLNLDRLSINPKDVEAFANQLAFTAYSESSKQMFLNKKIKELDREELDLKANAANNISQFNVDLRKIQERSINLKRILEDSKATYESIFDPTQQEKAFIDFTEKRAKVKEVIEKLADDVKKGKTPKKSKVKVTSEPAIDKEPIEEPANVTNTNDPTQITDLDELFGSQKSLKDFVKKNVTPEEYTAQREEADFLVGEALQTKSVEDFEKFERALKNNSILSKSDKEKLTAHKAILKANEGVKTQTSNDDDLVANYLSTNTVASKDTADKQIIANPKEYREGKFKDLYRSATTRANVVMMHLFEHRFIDGTFRFVRGEEGTPLLDNISNIDIEALNELRLDDKVSFKLVTLDKANLEKANKNRQESIEAISKQVKEGNAYGYQLDNDYGFDNNHIGIYTENGKLIGFVQQPHAISSLVKPDNLQAYIDARNLLIKERQFIVKELTEGKEVTSKVSEIGSGNLYTKLTAEGKIDPVNNVLNSVRDKDKAGGNAIFVYNSGTELKLPRLEDTKSQEDIEEAVAKLGNFGEPGAVFQLVKTPQGEWYVIPVYASLIDNKTANAIIKVLEVLPEDVDVDTLIRNLHPYIYASDKAGNIIVSRDERGTKLTINGNTYTLGSVHAARKAEFIADLKTKRQNIDRKNINTRATQAKLKDRNTLITNVVTFNGEYFVQPFITYNHLTSTKVSVTESKEAESNVTTPSVENPTQDRDLKDIYNIKDEDFNDYALSRTRFFDPYSTNKVDKDKFTNWLDKNLPGLSVYNTRSIADLKTNITDAVGAYKDMVIYLFDHSSNKTAYHEAFHGVFRNMLSPNERLELVNEIAKNTLKPTEENLEFIRNSYTDGYKYNTKQLEYKYYEELLADAFADYTDNFKEDSLSKKILDFFKRILEMFNLYTRYDNTKLDELFYNINTGKYKGASIKAKQEVINRPVPRFTEFVPSRIKGPDDKWELSASFKWDRTKSIGDSFLTEYQKIVNSGGKIDKDTAVNIYNNILAKYEAIKIDAKKHPSKYTKSQIIDVMKITSVFPQLVKESNKYLENIGLKVKDDNIEFKESTVIDEDVVDNEISTLVSNTTKGFGEWIHIPGLKSTSTRLKMFLSGIPVVENGKAKVDNFGFPIYHDFIKLYYFLERNLTGLYTFDEMLEVMDELSINRPEVATVKTRLLEEQNNITKDKLKSLQNDFKTNFSKQQLSYTLVKFDTDSGTGAVTFEIMDANRQTLGREIFDSWANNLKDPARDTIAVHNQDGTVSETGTPKAKGLLEEWNKVKAKDKLDYNHLNSILLKAGIEYSPNVLRKITDKSADVFKRNLSKVLNWYAADDASKLRIEGRKALSKLVKYEVQGKLTNYTQSFNNVENKSIYTVQLPSFASKLLSKITSGDPIKFSEEYGDLVKDESYKYNNILSELHDDAEFRTEYFKLNYLDGLKDDRGNSDGATFTDESPKDFMAMQIALFENNNVNQNNRTKENISKYIYITPADKTMLMIFDSKKYGVNIGDKGILSNSEIVSKFYNIVLDEATRIKKQLEVKSKVLAGELYVDELLEHYHYSKKTPPTKDKDGNWEIDKIEWNGQAYKFNNFGDKFNETFLGKVTELVSRNFASDTETDLEILKPMIIDSLITEMNREYKDTIAEAINKGIINVKDVVEDGKSRKEYVNIALDKNSKHFKNATSEHKAIRQVISEFALNSWLFNMDSSKLLNGDVALYKPADLQKRTYQSGSMTIMGNTDDKRTVKTMVVKDHYSETDTTSIVETLKELGLDKAEIDTIIKKYKDNNVTDAQVYVSPEFYKAIYETRGTWNDNMQKAYDIAEGKIKVNKVDEHLRQLLAGIKPFYFGKRFDETLGIQRYEQVKCAMLPLFKVYTEMNPLLAEKAQDMKNLGVDMIAHESAFKAAIGYRDNITSDSHVILDLDMDNFGIQVDNPNHTLDENNDSTRQIKMLLLGNIDPEKEYNGVSGKTLQDLINDLEGVNIRQDLDRLKKVINNPSDISFKKSMQERLTKRGATENVQQSLDIVNGEFVFPLDLGPTSTATENLISSIFTNDVIKQKFNTGGSAVQATALGLKYKSLEEQQEAVNKSPELLKLQTDLKWVRPGKGDQIEYAEAIMPAWSKEFFDRNGFIKDNVPQELREILIYRIPTEGYHSMLPIRVVKFLPETMGNFILLPYEITTQFGADFDFDKVFFIAPEFYKDVDAEGNEILTKYEFIDEDSKDSNDKRYKQYLRWAAAFNIKPLDEEDFYEQSLYEQNNRSARNNKILESYLKVLSSKQNLALLIKPSGFDFLTDLKEEIAGDTNPSTFFSSVTQRDYKTRNHITYFLKGTISLQVTGHSYGTMLGLNTERTGQDWQPDKRYVFRFNNEDSYDLGGLYNQQGGLIADELGMLQAAVMDDIKNPILKSLNLDKNTVPVACTIVRAGFGLKTAINLTTQPAIVELSKELEQNTYQIKALKQGWNTIDSLTNSYKNRRKAVLAKLEELEKDKEVEKTDAELEADRLFKLEMDKINAYNLSDIHLELWRDFEKNNNLTVNNDIKHVRNLALYYTYQVRVLLYYERYSKVADDLTKINRFFGINKEIGPNIENIIDKKYLLKEITDTDFSINGMEKLPNIASLDADYDAQLAALDWFAKYFPYDSAQNNSVKTNVALKQFKVKHNSSVILSMKADVRMRINGFLRTFIDNDFDFFKDVNSYDEKKRLFTELPKLISRIKDPRNDKEDFGNIKGGYGLLRHNIFIDQLQVRVDSGLGYISLKGNKLDTQIKNNLTESIYSLWNNPETKPLITDLIKHSYVGTGFFTGLNSFHSLIPLDILAEINYNKYRQDKLAKLANGNILFDEDTEDRIIDQLIRNFPKDFTQVFEKSMFEEKDKVLYTNDDMIKIAKRASGMFIGRDEEGETIYPTYIRVYDKGIKRSLIYKQSNKGEYHYVTSLGKPGKLIEINTEADIEKSILRDNNSTTKKSVSSNEPTFTVNSTPEDLDMMGITNDPLDNPVLETSSFGAIDPSQVQDLSIFGDIKPPSEDDIKNVSKDENKTPNTKPPLKIDKDAKNDCE